MFDITFYTGHWMVYKNILSFVGMLPPRRYQNAKSPPIISQKRFPSLQLTVCIKVKLYSKVNHKYHKIFILIESAQFTGIIYYIISELNSFMSMIH